MTDCEVVLLLPAPNCRLFIYCLASFTRLSFTRLSYIGLSYARLTDIGLTNLRLSDKRLSYAPVIHVGLLYVPMLYARFLSVGLLYVRRDVSGGAFLNSSFYRVIHALNRQRLAPNHASTQTLG